MTQPDGTQKAECIYCKPKLNYEGTTSTCLRHLRKCEPHKAYKDKQQLLNFPPDVDSGQTRIHSLIGLISIIVTK